MAGERQTEAQKQAAEIVALLRSYTNVRMTQALADLIEHKYAQSSPSGRSRP